MAKREQYTSNLTCPKCGKKGTVDWEENENQVYAGGFNKEMVSLSDGFVKGENKDALGDPEILCSLCKTRVSH